MHCEGIGPLAGYRFRVFMYTKDLNTEYVMVDMSFIPRHLMLQYSAHGGLMDSEQVLYEYQPRITRTLSLDEKSIYRWLTIGDYVKLTPQNNKESSILLTRKCSLS